MKMLLLGDLCPSKASTLHFKDKDVPALFNDTLPLFEGKDFVFANLECAITDSENKISKYGPHLKAPAETAEIMRQIGIHCVGLSNNHVFDFGTAGIADTLAALQRNGIAYTGWGDNYEHSRQNFVVEKKGEKIALIAVCEHEYSYALENRMGSRPFDEYHTVEDVRKAKEENDRVIVFYHGGKEHCAYPSPRLRRLCQALVRAGADVVLCQHSHCIGCYENYQDSHILYGQGNFHFVFPGSQHSGWFTSLAVDYDTKENRIAFTPLTSTDVGIRLADEQESAEILSAFEDRNASLQNGEWLRGWDAFCQSVYSTYFKAVARAFVDPEDSYKNGLFSHFLDCEAHTDVWRWIFPSLNLTNCIDEKTE